MVFYIMRAPLNGVLYNARTIKWCFYIMRAPFNGVLYNAHTIKWCFFIMRAPLNVVETSDKVASAGRRTWLRKLGGTPQRMSCLSCGRESLLHGLRAGAHCDEQHRMPNGVLYNARTI